MNGQLRTIDDLRRLAAAGVIDEEMVHRAAINDRGLAVCWCGHDMPEHNVDALEYGDGAEAPIQDHPFAAAGTRYIGWILGVAEGVDFRHDHGNDLRHLETPVAEFCVLCRVEAWERDQSSDGSV
jgi:hypothetical protein